MNRRWRPPFKVTVGGKDWSTHLVSEHDCADHMMKAWEQDPDAQVEAFDGSGTDITTSLCLLAIRNGWGK